MPSDATLPSKATLTIAAGPALPAPVPLLGIDFTDLPLDRVVDWLVARPAGAPFGYVVTPNADHLVRLARNPAI
ncbi:MAG: glycosyltransferase, partial [Belnapia sp.]|nr:glycosyltransferase [Belnapia sp.]